MVKNNNQNLDDIIKITCTEIKSNYSKNISLNNLFIYTKNPKFKINKKVKHYGKMPRKLKKKYKTFYYKHGYFEIDSFYSCNYFFGNKNDSYIQAKEIFGEI